MLVTLKPKRDSAPAAIAQVFAEKFLFRFGIVSLHNFDIQRSLRLKFIVEILYFGFLLFYCFFSELFSSFVMLIDWLARCGSWHNGKTASNCRCIAESQTLQWRMLAGALIAILGLGDWVTNSSATSDDEMHAMSFSLRTRLMDANQIKENM